MLNVKGLCGLIFTHYEKLALIIIISGVVYLYGGMFVWTHPGLISSGRFYCIRYMKSEKNNLPYQYYTWLIYVNDYNTQLNVFGAAGLLQSEFSLFFGNRVCYMQYCIYYIYIINVMGHINIEVTLIR